MIPTPPGLAAIVGGLTYAMQLSCAGARPSAMQPSAVAIWDALWFRYMLTLLNGGLILGLGNMGAALMLAVLGLLDVLSYLLSAISCCARCNLTHYTQFILAVTWVGNLRVMILMMIILMTTPVGLALDDIHVPLCHLDDLGNMVGGNAQH